jgi:hypothetical protein
MKPLLLFLLLFSVLTMPLPSWATHEEPQSSSLFGHASAIPQPFHPNGNAGYQGSDLPPSEYNPDTPRYGARSKTDATPPLDNGMYSGRSVIETPNGRMVCFKPDFSGRVLCQ